MLVVGLTGGICSGKTTVSDYFSQLGVSIIDADEISRSLLTESILLDSPPLLLKIRDYFGQQVFDKKGFLIRSKLKARLFNQENNSDKKILENMIHPEVYQKINQQIKHYKQRLSSNSQAHPYLIISIPLLIETADLKLFDRILVVDIDEKTQIERCLKRDNIDKEMISNIIKAQICRTKRLSYADDIIDNSNDDRQLLNTSIENTSLENKVLENITLKNKCIKSKVNELHHFYLQLTKESNSTLIL